MTIEIIENSISPAILRAAKATWPSCEWSGWHRYKGPTADKYGSVAHAPIPHAIRAALDTLAMVSGEYLPHHSFIDYDLHAAGLHQIPPGGFLGRHVDAECHPFRPWKRTHSIVLFVDTLESIDGGTLVIEPDDYFQPVENRAVIFETHETWHHVSPTSSTAPMRRTLALFAWRVDHDCDGLTSAKFSETLANDTRATAIRLENLL